MVENKNSLKDKKKNTKITIKASLLPRLRNEINKNALKKFLFMIIGRISRNEMNGIFFGMKSAQRLIRRNEAKVVLIDSLLPKCLIGTFSLVEL